MPTQAQANSKYNHTPGPWGAYGDRLVIRGNSGKTDVAEMEVITPGKTAVGCDQTWANAKLIAAAPELLRVLDSIAGHAQNATQRNRKERPTTLLDFDSTIKQIQIMAREAIAKATDN